MLDAMRRASESWFGRIVMGLVMTFIIISFAIWGIGDIFRGFGGDNVAKVGGRTITIEQFKSAYLRELNQLQQRDRRAISPQEAHATGLDVQILSKLISDTALDEQAQRLGLAMSDKAVDNSIIDDPAFKGTNGKFDPSIFASILQNNGLTEAMLAQEQRGLYLRREIASAVAQGIRSPHVLLSAINHYRNETRSIEYVTLPASAAGAIPSPTDKQLEAYFNARLPLYKAPEYRKLVVLAITPASVADPSAVSEAAAHAVYNKNKSQYGTPEKRLLTQATFPTQAEAAQAIAKTKAGAQFAAAAQASQGAIVHLGLLQKADLFDPTIAKAAFSAPAGALSAPVKGQFGWVVLKVDKIEAASIKPFSAVEASIKQAIASQQAGARVDTLRDKIEDQRTDGKTLTQAAKSVGLKTEVIAAANAKGLDQNGKKIPNIPDRDALLKAAFASDVGMDNDYLSTPDGGFVWFEVASVTQARERTLAEVKPQVEAAWRQGQVSKRLEQKADALVKQLQTGTPFAKVAKSVNLPVQAANDVRRIGASDAPPQVVAGVFNVPVKGAGSAAPNATSRVVFKVEDSVIPPFDPSDTSSKAIIAQLGDQLTDDVLAEYLGKLQSDVGVSVDQQKMASAISGAQQY